MKSCSSNCTAWHAYVYAGSTDYPSYDADPDIAGIGIIFAFVASSFITLCFGLANLIFTSSPSSNENFIDVWIFRLLRYPDLFHVKDNSRDFWIPVITKVILVISDQQILTGLSILIIGFVTHCSISAYHFAIVDDLAWFSANTHLTSLGILRGYLLQRPLSRDWRILLMICVAIFIFASTVLQGHWAYYRSWSFSAQCLFNDLIGNVGGGPGVWMWIDLIAIAIIYPMSMLPVYERPSLFIHEKLYEMPMGLLEAKIRAFEDEELEAKGRLSMVTAALWGFLTATKMVYLWIATMINSRCLLYVIDLAWFGYGVANVISNRSIPASESNGNEDAMTFSQILIILLLASTLVIFKKAYQDQKMNMYMENQQRRRLSEANLLQSHQTSAVASPFSQDSQMKLREESEGSTTPTGSSHRPADLEMGERLQASGREGRPGMLDIQKRSKSYTRPD